MSSRQILNHRFFFVVWLAFFLGLAMSSGCSRFRARLSSSKPFVHYKVSIADSYLKIVMVEGDVRGITQKETVVYPVKNDSGRVSDPIAFSAKSIDGKSLKVDRVKGGWRVKNEGKDFSFFYKVPLAVEDRYSSDVRTMLTMMNTDYCRFVARDIIFLCRANLADGIIVDFDIPDDWELDSSAMSIRKRTVIDDASELPLTSIVCGKLQNFEANIDGVKISMASVGKWRFRAEDLFELVRRITSYEINLFGDSPRDKFLVIAEPNPVKAGRGFDYYGIHLGGTIFLFLSPKMDGSMLFDAPMSVVAHELFHNWNGEALPPASNAFLWFTEGATVYYSYKVIEGTGIITSEQYRARRNLIYERFINNRYHGKVPIRMAQNNNLNDKDMVSLFYDGGFLTCEALDAMIKEKSKGKVELIDVLRYMYDNRKQDQYINQSVLVDAIKRLSGYNVSSALHNMLDDPSVEFSSNTSSSLD